MPVETLETKGLQDPAFAADLDKLFPEDKTELPTAAPKGTPPPDPKGTPAPDPKATPTPTPPAPTDDKDKDLPEDIRSATEKNKSSWRKREESFAKERDSLKAETDKLRADYKALQEKADKKDINVADLPEYKSLKADYDRINGELEKFSERLRLVDVEKHPKFEAYFNGKIEQAMNIAKSAGGDRAVQLLQLPPSEYRTEQLESLVSELGQFKGGQLVNASVALEQIHAERTSEINRARENYKAMIEQEKVQQQTHRETLSKTFASVRDEVTKNLPALQLRDGDDKWNKSVQESMALAEHIYSGDMKADDKARAAFWSAAAPNLLASLQAEQAARAQETTDYNAKVAALEKTIADLRGASPNPGGEGGEPRPGGENPNQTPLERLMEDIGNKVPGLK